MKNTSLLLDKITVFLKENNNLKLQNEDIINRGQAELDDLFRDIISVIDSFDNAETVIKEKELDKTEESQKAIKRLLVAKKKLIALLDKYGVNKINFSDGMANDGDCQIADTMPDKDKKENQIISVERDGYRRKDRLLRPAEVIVVKN